MTRFALLNTRQHSGFLKISFLSSICIGLAKKFTGAFSKIANVSQRENGFLQVTFLHVSLKEWSEIAKYLIVFCQIVYLAKQTFLFIYRKLSVSLFTIHL